MTLGDGEVRGLPFPRPCSSVSVGGPGVAQSTELCVMSGEGSEVPDSRGPHECTAGGSWG